MERTAELGGMERAAYRDTQKDGLTEIVSGVFLFIVALATGRPAFYWTYLVGLLVLGRGLRWLKARYTYERIGYVELPDEDPSKLRRGMLYWVLGVFGVAVAALAVMGDLTDNLAWRQWSPAIAGFLCMGGFLYAASRSGLLRQYVYAAISPALGLLLARQEFAGSYQGVRVWALVMALLLLGTGGIVLRRFLHEVPPAGDRGPESVDIEDRDDGGDDRDPRGVASNRRAGA